MVELLNNGNFVWGAMAILVLCLSQIIKLPIKALTKKLIKDNDKRTRVNIVIMLIPLGLGVLGDWLFCTYYLGVAFSIAEGVKIGGTAITLYGMLEKAIKGVQSKETTETIKLVEDITKDGKIDKSDNSLLKDFANKLNSIK